MSENTDWMARADELQEKGGVPKRRAEVVALREQGLTYSEISEELGGIASSNISEYLSLYREQDLAGAQWLVEHAPELDG